MASQSKKRSIRQHRRDAAKRRKTIAYLSGGNAENQERRRRQSGNGIHDYLNGADPIVAHVDANGRIPG